MVARCCSCLVSWAGGGPAICVILVAFVAAVYSSLFLEPRRAVEFTANMKARLLGLIWHDGGDREAAEPNQLCKFGQVMAR